MYDFYLFNRTVHVELLSIIYNFTKSIQTTDWRLDNVCLTQ